MTVSIHVKVMDLANNIAQLYHQEGSIMQMGKMIIIHSSTTIEFTLDM